jgi:hypothetical protein
MAERGRDTLSFGPMKPVGLTDPRTGLRPHAVIQLRQEDEAATAYNLVGFQTRMKYADQLRVFRMVPGLEQAEFMRMGSVHRNTFVNAPELLSGTMELKSSPGLYLAGQVSGVEGYVESAAGGFLCALMLAQKLRGEAVVPPPPTTALGGILTHLARKQPRYQPSNITWAHLPPLEGQLKRLKKRERYDAMAARAGGALRVAAERLEGGGGHVDRGLIAAHAEHAEVVEAAAERLVEPTADEDRRDAEVGRVEDHLEAALRVGHRALGQAQADDDEVRALVEEQADRVAPAGGVEEDHRAAAREEMRLPGAADGVVRLRDEHAGSAGGVARLRILLHRLCVHVDDLAISARGMPSGAAGLNARGAPDVVISPCAPRDVARGATRRKRWSTR